MVLAYERVSDIIVAFLVFSERERRNTLNIPQFSGTEAQSMSITSRKKTWTFPIKNWRFDSEEISRNPDHRSLTHPSTHRIDLPLYPFRWTWETLTTMERHFPSYLCLEYKPPNPGEIPMEIENGVVSPNAR